MNNLDQQRPQENETRAEQTAQEPAAPEAGAWTLPEDAIVIVPVRGMVLFPGMILPVTIGREMSIAAAQAAVKAERPIGLLLQKDPKVDLPTPEDLYQVGTIAQILRYVTTADGTH